MKLRILSLALVASLASASVALGKGGPTPGKAEGPAATGCKPKVALILKGTFLSGGTDSFQMDVKRSNKHARALRGTREVKVNAQTKFRRGGNSATLASLQANDRLNVQVRACKRMDAATMELLAKRVIAKAPQAPKTPESS